MAIHNIAKNNHKKMKAEARGTEEAQSLEEDAVCLEVKTLVGVALEEKKAPIETTVRITPNAKAGRKLIKINQIPMGSTSSQHHSNDQSTSQSRRLQVRSLMIYLVQ